MAYTFLRMQNDFRKITGKRTTAQMSAADVKAALNDFYRVRLPEIISPPEFKGWYSVNTAASTETYALPATIIAVSAPLYLDDEQIDFYTDKEAFFDEYAMDDTDTDQPTGVLLFDRTLYVRKIPDGIYTLKMRKVSSTPDELVADADLPDNELWGRAIVYGAAIELKSDEGDTDGVQALAPIYKTYVGLIHNNTVAQIPIGTRNVPAF